ncbi:MAG: HlyD family efflux transporter periplasmic adaptor subunit [Bacteroidota bacterium]
MLCLLLLILEACKEEKSTKPQYKALTEAVYASGNIIPRNEYKVFATTEGYLSKKVVIEGEAVKKNQILFVLENTQQDIRTNDARDAYQMAVKSYGSNSPVLDELQESLRTSRLNYHNDSVNYIRYHNLWQQQATTKVAYEQAALNYKSSLNNYQAQRARYRKTKDDLLRALQNARSQYALQQEQNTDYQLKSEIDGLVYEIYKEEGELIQRNEPIALLGAANEVYLELNVDEQDIDKVKIGQEILVKIDVYPTRVFKAKVSKIYQMLDRQTQSFRVDALFTERYPGEFAGLTVEANIITQYKPKALVIPKAFVIGDDSLWIIQNGKEKKIRFQKGIENYDWVEVQAGVDTTTKIILK